MSPDDATDQLRVGQILADRYRVERLIGRGGMAEVYGCHDDRLARPVALKVLRSRYGADPDLRQRFEEEARAAALVSHPNVVAVYDAGEDDSKAFIVMELVAGETLHDRIARGPVSATVARSIGGQILDALAAAHAKGVLHRDIKPANVLITPEGQAKVADFGIAKAVDPSQGDHDQTSMNMVLGTPSYLAPERAQGEQATVASDLWSVGVLLYEAVAGVKPFEADNPIAITLAAQQARYVPVLERRHDIDPALAAVIERAIEPDPNRRFSSAEEMAEALRGHEVDTTRLLAAGAAGLPLGVGGPADSTQLLGSPTERAGLGAGALGAGAALGAGGAAAAHTVAYPATGGTPPPGAGGRGRQRQGIAVLIGAILALLLGSILALVLTNSGGGGPGPTLTVPPTTQPKATTSAPTSTSASTTTSTKPTTTTTSTVPPTTTSTVPPTTTSTLPTTTSTLPTTTSTLPTTTSTVPPTT